MDTIIVVLGAGLGGGFRHSVNVAVSRLLPGTSFPVSTLLINVVGSFLIGVLAEGFALRGAAGHPLKLFLTTGMLGGFTTFSTFSLDAVALYERGNTLMAAAYVLGSVAAALLGLVAGLALVRLLLSGAAS